MDRNSRKHRTLVNVELKNIKAHDISAASLGLVLALLCFNQKVLPLLIAIWVLASLYACIKTRNSFELNTRMLLLPALFLLLLVGVGWSENKETAWFDLEVKMTFMIVPLLFMYLKYQLHHFVLILRFFVLGTIAAVLYLLIRATIQFILTGELSSLMYYQLGGNIHPAYLSYYVNTAIIFIFLDYRGRQLSIFPKGWQYIASVALFSVFSVLLMSKNGIITTGLLGLFFLIHLWRKGYWKWVSLAVLGMGVSFGVLYKKSVYVQDRLDDLIFGFAEGSTDKWLESSTMRMVIWENGLVVYKDSPLIGHGTGDVKDVLFKQYQADNAQRLVDLNLNAHNQFLQTGIAVGIVGVGLLAVALFIPLVKVRRNMAFCALFSLITFIFFMTESVLETQTGVLGFVFFLTLTYYLEQVLRNSTLTIS